MNWIKKFLSKSVSAHGKYRSDIDGLRAVAVGIVVLYHAHLGVSGGYVGVDVFFVISGYLITGLILQDFDAGQFSLLQFWERRVRRILPALAVVVGATTVAAWFLFIPGDYRDFGVSLIAQSLLVSNFYFFLHSGYFEKSAGLIPLLHTWSLAVEEQFYFFFPLLLMALSKIRREVAAHIILALGLASLALSIYLSYAHASSNFYLLPSRAWELMVGAYLTMIKARQPVDQAPRELVALAGLVAIFYSAFAYTFETPFPGLAATLPCFGAGAIIWANGPALTWVGKLLSLPAVVFVGLISYSLYLWHWPILVFGNYWNVIPDSVSKMHEALLLGASFIAAILSWKFVETPFRKRVFLHTRAQAFSFGAGTLAALALAGCAIVAAHGFPSRFPAEAVGYASGINDVGIRTEINEAAARRGDFIELGHAAKTTPIQIFVWGDSHAMTVLSVMDTLCQQHGVRGVAATHASTAPLVGFAADLPWSLKQAALPYNDAIMHFIQTAHPHDVLLAAKWSSYPDQIPQVHQQLLVTIHLLNQAGARVWILRQVPRPGRNVPRALAWNASFGKDGNRIDFPLDSYHAEARVQDPILAGISTAEATILDADSIFIDPDNHFVVAAEGHSLYFDHHHLSVAGAKKLSPLLEKIFAE